MKIYLFFKKYYVAMGYKLAMFLSKQKMHPNTASLISIFIIFPMFFFIDNYIYNNLLLTIYLFIAINIKLILNAIDGIIARDQNINTKFGMFLNVGTDILPDLYIIYIILNKLGVDIFLIYYILLIIIFYFILEILFIYLYNKQNIFIGGKESRTFFYLLILIVGYFNFNYNILLYFYIFITILHNAGFFIKKYRN
ncbi:CDP-alcohol phosphatidyltransferase family protein [Candidatus Vampirococcus lugosii]|uniref:CDP-alcohol phosphatidyltransferase n=1 Tax=Candidatus Vampirococcus lugosii TaxID=2789015 RepID=A0ABS5QL37_9BACT|nr:CDP-alcohol phosphatidyltransferase family protein [Candidatus Vampirococcus lugosii]MBS8121814.1 hypothetical protein [Candidatus Vampirococcus lugosii]